MAVEDDIQFERDGHIARVWLNRPHKQQLRHGADAAPARRDHHRGRVNDPEIRAVLVLRGRGNTFSSGFDLDSLQADFIGSEHGHGRRRASRRRCATASTPMSKPSVAVLEGYVTAGGFEVMISCDFAIARTSRP